MPVDSYRFVITAPEPGPAFTLAGGYYNLAYQSVYPATLFLQTQRQYLPDNPDYTIWEDTRMINPHIAANDRSSATLPAGTHRFRVAYGTAHVSIALGP
jgi:hypothetical protein